MNEVCVSPQRPSQTFTPLLLKRLEFKVYGSVNGSAMLTTHQCVCMRACVRMCVCVCVCVHICALVWVCVCVCVVCSHRCMCGIRVCLYICVFVCVSTSSQSILQRECCRNSHRGAVRERLSLTETELLLPQKED